MLHPRPIIMMRDHIDSDLAEKLLHARKALDSQPCPTEGRTLYDPETERLIHQEEKPSRKKWFLQRQGEGTPFIGSYLHEGCAILKIKRACTFEEAKALFKKN